VEEKMKARRGHIPQRRGQRKSDLFLIRPPHLLGRALSSRHRVGIARGDAFLGCARPIWIGWERGRGVGGRACRDRWRRRAARAGRCWRGRGRGGYPTRRGVRETGEDARTTTKDQGMKESAGRGWGRRGDACKTEGLAQAGSARMAEQ